MHSRRVQATRLSRFQNITFTEQVNVHILFYWWKLRTCLLLTNEADFLQKIIARIDVIEDMNLFLTDNKPVTSLILAKKIFSTLMRFVKSNKANT